MPTLAELGRRKREEEETRNRILSRLIQPSTASALGKSIGRVDAREAERRTKTLRQLLNAGQLDPNELGPQDRRYVGSRWLNQFQGVTPPGEEDPSFLGIGGPVGESIGNFFGGAVQFAKGLPKGLYEAGSAVASDIGSGLTDPAGIQRGFGFGGDSQVVEKIVEPTLEYYGEKYSGSPREIARKALVEDPFGTVLDVGALASLGAGSAGRAGSVASKAGVALEGAAPEGSALARAGSQVAQAGEYFKGFGYAGTRGKRPDLTVGKNVPIPREYGISPVVRTGQKLTDRYLDRIPGPFGAWRSKFAQHGIINTLAGRTRILGSFMAATQSRDFIKAAKSLTDDEATALTLLKNGVNLQPVRPAGGVQRGNVSALEAFKEYLDASLANQLPEGYNVQQLQRIGVDPEYVRELRRKLDDPEFVALIQNPTENIAKASQVWDQQVERNLQTHPIDAEEHQRRVWAPQQALRVKPERLDEYDNVAAIEAIKDPSGAFDRFAAKYAEETGEPFPVRPNYIPHELAEGTFGGKLTEVERSKPVEAIRLAEANVAKQHPTYLTPSDMQAFLSGAVQVGTRPMVNFIQQRERYLAHEGFISQLVDKLAERDRNGEVVRASSRSDMEAKGYSRQTHVSLDLEGALRFYRNETDYLQNVIDMVEEVKKDSPREVANRADKITEGVREFAEASGRKTVQEMMGVSKPEGIVVTREAAKHIKSTLEALRPAESVLGRGYDRLMSMWRSMTLAFMPRWYINTFVGSTFLTLLSGAVRPKYYVAAARYGGRGEKAAKLMKRAPELKPGIYGAELYEAQSLGRRRKAPSKAVFERVENIESFFKRVGFFRSLDKEAKAAMRQLDEVMEGYDQNPWMRDEWIDNILDNHPEMVDHALNEVNKFYYNYTQLGPFERRWVRRVVPFWGWYKFVTKLIYQLPFQYPGRTLVLDKLSRISQEFEDQELGILPFDIKGAIFLNRDRENLKYIPTFGLNPLSDFANPAAPEGTLQGLISTQQLAPLFGAFIQSLGLDPYRGTPNELSPESNLIMGPFGRVINPETGEEVPGGLSGAFSTERFIGSLARAIPQVRTLETVNTGGRYVYPESIPFIDEKPIPVEAGEAYGEGGSLGTYLMQSFLGGYPRTENLRSYQNRLREDVEYGQAVRKNALKRLRKSGVQ